METSVTAIATERPTRFDVLNEHIMHAIQRCAKPRVHQNGFIQVDVDKDTRLHFWGHPDIPRQKVRTDIHDHVYGFTSSVLIGRLFNIVYHNSEEKYGDYEVYIPQFREGDDTMLVPYGQRMHISAPEIQIVRVAYNEANRWNNINTYSMRPKEFHETFAPEPTVTLMKKTVRVQGVARILVPVGKEPDNDFNRYTMLDDQTLWNIIDDIVAVAR